MHKTYQAGECVQSQLVNLISGTPTDATTVTITITDPAATVLVDEEAMTKSTTGVYVHNYDLATDADPGRYSVEITVTISGHVTKVYSSFNVK